MKRFWATLAMGLSFALLGQASFALAEGTLLGVSGASGELSKVYIIDSGSGDFSELGQLTLDGEDLSHVASMSLNVNDGFVYFINNVPWRSEETKKLMRIELTRLLSGSTSVELVATLDKDELGNTPDMTFSDDGTLYVWNEGGDDLMILDHQSGDLTRLESVISSWATGLSFDENGILWVKTSEYLAWIELNMDGNSILSESDSDDQFNRILEYYNDDMDWWHNLLSRAPDGSLWTGARTNWGDDDPADTILASFTPSKEILNVEPVYEVTVSGVKLSAIEWVRGSLGKDRTFWTAVENCRLDMASALYSGKEVSASTYQSCFFTGVNSSNAAAVNAALKDMLAKAAASGTAMSHADLMKAAAQIADRLDLVQRLSTGKLVYAAEFEAAGINLGAYPTKTLDGLKALPSADVDTLEELLVQIQKVA